MVRTRAWTAAQEGSLLPSSKDQDSQAAKRKQSVEDASPPNQKRQRTRLYELTPCESVINNGARGQTDPIAFWVEEGRWPEEQFWLEEISVTPETSERVPIMEALLARKKALSKNFRKRSNSATSITPSDQRPREEKSTPYRNVQYQLLLQTKGSYMMELPLDITDQRRLLCQTLLNNEQATPKDSLFDDDIFKRSCNNLQSKNEAKIIQDVSRLIVPSAEQYALRRDDLGHLVESVNEGWNNSIPLTGPRPQPDYSVGFGLEAFTKDQRTKLSPLIGDFLSGD